MAENAIFEFYDSIDDVAGTTEEQREAFRITNDNEADWAVRKIKESKAEYDRINEIAAKQIQRVGEALEAAGKRHQNNTAFLTGKLREYFQTVPHKETKTQEQYQLLSGKLVWTLPKQTIQHDDAALLDFLKTSGRTEYIKTTEAPAWGEYKKALAIEGAQVIDTETGEIVPGLTVSETEAKFEVK